jgi:hypothetical protein
VIIYLFPERGKHTQIFIRHCFLAFLKKKGRNDFSVYTFFSAKQISFNDKKQKNNE